MKLYYSAGSCSTSCHMTLEESGLKYQVIAVNWDNEADPNIPVATRLNPLGTLPILVTDSGEVLSQNIAIHTYIANQVPEKKLLPPSGTIERAQAMNWLSFIAADFHKSFSPLFSLDAITKDKGARGEVRNWAIGNISEYLAYLDRNISGTGFLMGKDFTVADAYCFVVANWTHWLDISLEPYKNLQTYLKRVSDRPAIQKVLKEEGL